MNEIKEFVEMMEKMQTALIITSAAHGQEDVVALKVISKLIDTNAFQELKATYYNPLDLEE